MARPERYDVVVAGGGSAGVAAAIGAARAGARVALVERTGCLGGAATVRAYFVIDLSVTDQNLMHRFESANHMVDKYDGEFLVRSRRYDVIEGDWRPERILIEEYPNRQAIHDMYDDPDNAELKNMRQSASTARALAVDGYTPESKGWPERQPGGWRGTALGAPRLRNDFWGGHRARNATRAAATSSAHSKTHA